MPRTRFRRLQNSFQLTASGPPSSKTRPMTSFRATASAKQPATSSPQTGRQRIQRIGAGDVAGYFAEAVARKDVIGRVFELGGPDAVSWNEFWSRLKRVRGMRRPSVHVPVGLMRANAVLTERLPGNIPLTRDLLTMLEHGDNVATDDEAVRTFELPLLPLDEQLRRAS